MNGTREYTRGVCLVNVASLFVATFLSELALRLKNRIVSDRKKEKERKKAGKEKVTHSDKEDEEDRHTQERRGRGERERENRIESNEG